MNSDEFRNYVKHRREFNAQGNKLGNSQPIIINIVNTSPFPVANVNIYGSGQNRGGTNSIGTALLLLNDLTNSYIIGETVIDAANNSTGIVSYKSGNLLGISYIKTNGAGFNPPNHVIGITSGTNRFIVTATNYSLTISGGIAGVSYTQVIANSENKPFTAGRTLVISSSAGQIQQKMTVVHVTDDGDVLNHTITPAVDPYQGQMDRLADDYEYKMDAMTSLTIAQVNAGATIQLQVYPIIRFSGTAIANGQNPVSRMKDITGNY
jgi:hypothetical protein